MSENQKVVEKTDKERLEDYDKMVGVLSHKDWAIVKAYFNDAMAFHQMNMEESENWEQFLQYRALRDFIKLTIVPLYENLKADRDALAERLADMSVEADTNPLED